MNNISVRFNINDSVYLIENGQVVHAVIVEITIRLSRGFTCHPTLRVHYTVLLDNGDLEQVVESNLFGSSEEVITHITEQLEKLG